MSKDRHSVIVFVDWDSARRCAWLPSNGSERLTRLRRPPEECLSLILERVAKVVSAKCSRYRCIVDVRVYHAWHQGLQETTDYVEFSSRCRSGRTIDDIVFRPPVAVTSLACGGPNSELRDTLRVRDGYRMNKEQKMVDTAIASDLLFYARTHSSDPGSCSFIVLGEDDDLIPPVIVAEYWKLNCWILRFRPAGKYMSKNQKFLIGGL